MEKMKINYWKNMLKAKNIRHNIFQLVWMDDYYYFDMDEQRARTAQRAMVQQNSLERERKRHSHNYKTSRSNHM